MDSENALRRRKNLILSIIITVIVVYAAVPAYGIIRDISTGGHVFVLTANLPGVRTERPAPGIAGRLYRFFSPRQEVAVPVGRRIDLEGRAVFSDGTPYANGLIELRSTPRYTRTDSLGYFKFLDIGEGAHTVRVLDEAGKALANSAVDIDRASGPGKAVVAHHRDGKIVVQVPEDVKVLEVTVVLKNDGGGNITGIEDILVEAAPESGRQPDNPANPNGPVDPANPNGPAGPTVPDIPVEPPAPPDIRPAPPDIPPGPPMDEEDGGGGGGGGGSPRPFDFGVMDTDTGVSYGTAGAARVDIFGAAKIIAPGMSGRYRFTVDNTGNGFPSRYNITFTLTGTLPDGVQLPMRFRLKEDGVYVAGNEKEWCPSLSNLNRGAVVAGGADVTYTLEWSWPEGANDNEFAPYAGYSYGIVIKVTAKAL